MPTPAAKLAAESPAPELDSAVPVHRLFESQAARSPWRSAVVAGEQSLDYRELDERSNRIARHLLRLGVRPGELVGVAMRRSPWMVAALLGVWKAGCAYVPLDPGYPAQRLAFMASDANLRWLLTDEASRNAVAGMGGQIVSLDATLHCPSPFKGEVGRGMGETNHRNPARLPHPHPSPPLEGEGEDLAIALPAPCPDDPAYAIYTSGSTGQPKGVLVTHRGLSNYLRWAVHAYGVKPGSSVPVHSSLSFDLTVTSLYVPLLVGAEVELLAEEAGPLALADALRAKKRSLVKLTPSHLELLNRELRPDEYAGMADVLVIGGENLAAERVEPWRKHAPGTRLINEYGPTEAVVGCCRHEIAADDPASGYLPIGRAMANARLYVLDGERRPVPAGETGELYIGGPGVASGYLNRPELTAQRFVADPFSHDSRARLYRSGDRVRRRGDGVLEYLGRFDDQVKVRGYRIEPAEIEQALAAHPEVSLCAAVACEDGVGGKALVGFVAPPRGRAPSSADIADFARSRLPAWMMPDSLVLLDDMPLNPNGKIDRAALAALAATRDSSPVGEPEPLDGPHTGTDAKVAAAFREVFGREVSRFENFFDRGGHSMMAVRLMAALRKATGADLPLRLLYEHPTPAGLAQAVDALAWAQADDPAPWPRPGAPDRMRISL